MSKLAFFVYRWFLAPTLVALLNLLRPLLRGKLRQIVNARGNPPWPNLVAKPIWVHASSGEIEYAKPLIREIKKKHPQIPVLLTYFSPSALRLVQNFAGLDVIWPLPFDTRRSLQRFFDHVQPRTLLISRTDVWPELAYQARLRAVPS